MSVFGYTFKNEAVLEEALTAPAYRMDHPGANDNQRLEFLGDAVLEILAAERLFAEFPNETEGSLTVRRTHMVSTVALCKVARHHGLDRKLKRNRNAIPLGENAKTLADAVEAIFGAAYLDGGLEAARTMFAAIDLDANAQESEWSANPKGELQVRTQSMTPPRKPVYEMLKISGSSHQPVFTFRVTVEGLGSAVASAGSKKDAESLAARKLLEME